MSPLSPADRARLLAIARGAIAGALEGRPPTQERFEGALAVPRAAFVTLRSREGDDLRGCIGRTEAREPLGTTVAYVAVQAATRDTRFPPLTLEGLDKVWLEVSALTPPEPIAPGDVQVGVHGLIVRLGTFSGLLLPQVAVDYGWDRETFLAQTSRKAGLPLDAWQHPEATLLCFTAEVFREK